MDSADSGQSIRPVIETSHLVKVYKHAGTSGMPALDFIKGHKEGSIRAVDELDLKIYKREIYALIGANSSGKTTLINMLTGALFPTSGSIHVLGFEIPKHRRDVATMIGVAPQEYALYNDLSVEQNVWFFAKLYGMSKAAFERRFNELVAVLNLAERRKTTIADLSGGMKRRVSIACALIHNPTILFFDEATVGIDPVLRAFFWGYFRSLVAAGSTIVLTSHVMDEAERADRIGLMRSGRLVEEGSPSEIKQRQGVSSIEEVFIKLSKGEVVDR